jgi:NADH-quinone oxidoreductase subunit N
MIESILLVIAPVISELILMTFALILLMVGVFSKLKDTNVYIAYAIVALSVACVATIFETDTFLYAPSFESLLISNKFIRFGQFAIMITAIIVLAATGWHLKLAKSECFEYPILMLFSVLGMVTMVASNDLIAFFIALELQSIPIYILIAMNRSSSHASEAAIKYFLLGMISSIIILFGASYVYGYAATTDFNGIAVALQSLDKLPWPLVLGVSFMIAGLCFKVSVVPFHMWTPDVYQGSPTPMTLFLASVPKLTGMVFIMRFLFGPFGHFTDMWQPIIEILAIASMVLGAFAALFQVNIKRLLAYSTISHMGYAFMGVATSTIIGAQSVLIYMVIYMAMIIGIFGCILNLRRHGQMMEDIIDLQGLSKTNPKGAFCIAVLMFSLAGIPPLAGFFGKFVVFMAAIDAQLYTIAVIAVLTTVVGAFYYLRIIKLMYFDDPVGGINALPYDTNTSRETTIIVAVSVAVNVLFFAWPDPVIKSAEKASVSLFETI